MAKVLTQNLHFMFYIIMFINFIYNNYCKCLQTLFIITIIFILKQKLIINT
jgi:hypothetical protein